MRDFESCKIIKNGNKKIIKNAETRLPAHTCSFIGKNDAIFASISHIELNE